MEAWVVSSLFQWLRSRRFESGARGEAKEGLSTEGHRYVCITRKRKKPLSTAKALEIVGEYLTWTVVENTGRLLTEAIALQQRAKLSFWDSLVVQAAIEARCDRLYSEDLNHDQKFGPVVIVNPFQGQAS